MTTLFFRILVSDYSQAIGPVFRTQTRLPPGFPADHEFRLMTTKT
jgi:hypothetical protein